MGQGYRFSAPPSWHVQRSGREVRATSGAVDLVGVTTVARRVATDKDMQDNLKLALDELRTAADRVQGKKDHGGRNSTLLLAGIMLGILFNPATGPQTRKWLSDKLFGANDEFTYQGSGNSS